MAKGNFGERLRREREMREVTIEEVVKSTRIPRRYVEALENENWAALPGGVFARGFVRSIAQFLGLDEESLLAEYDLARRAEADGATGPAPGQGPQGIPRAVPRWAAVLALALLLAALAAAAVYGWRRYAARRMARRSTAVLLELHSGGAPSLRAAAGRIESA